MRRSGTAGPGPAFFAAAGLAIALVAPARADDVASRLEAIANEHPELVTTSRIGTSREGRPIPVVRLGRTTDGDPGRRPALLVVAGLDGRHAVGTRVALGLAESLVRDHAGALAETTVYVIPRVNPDGAARGIEGVLVPQDDDRDGRVDEDPPDDLDGNGVITRMRIADPPPGIEPTHALDDEDPRLLVPADPEKGIRPTHAVLREGGDDDGDGSIGEDGEGQVRLDRNFPHLWPEVGAGIGRYPLSEPESRALADWMLARENIAAVLVFGPHDSIVNVPPVGKYDATRRAPLGLEKADEAYHREMRRLFTEITGIERADEVDGAGSFHRWAYAQFGVPTFATPVWTRPAASRDAAESKGEGKGKGGGASAARGKRTGKKDDPAAEERAWLAYSDAERRGDLFVEWTEVEHPELGTVEVGGFVPGYRFDAPDDATGRLVDEQTRFALAILERLPDVRVHEPWVERLAPGVHRVGIAVSNQGFLPTTSAIGVRTRRLLPLLVKLDLPREQVIAGEPIVRHDTVPGSGGRVTAQWVISAKDGSTAGIEVRSTLSGTRRLEVELAENRGSIR